MHKNYGEYKDYAHEVSFKFSEVHDGYDRYVPEILIQTVLMWVISDLRDLQEKLTDPMLTVEAMNDIDTLIAKLS
jgi:hypothetical protein